jgi:beta-barrel assembly-enhancing protease
MKSLFEAIGYKLGKTAANAKSLFELLGGEEEESLRAEIRLGHDLAVATIEQVPLVRENTSTQFATRVGHWLTANLNDKRLPFTFRFTAERALNAFALPGGHVFVSWPLLEVCQGQRDEIAFVLGHEMAHIKLRHTLDRVVRDSVFSLLLRQSPGRNAASAWLKKVGQQALSHAYSRESELAADSFALSLIRTCGGDVLAGEQLLEKLAQRQHTQSVATRAEYLATHPPLAERIANLRSERSAWGASSSSARLSESGAT